MTIGNLIQIIIFALWLLLTVGSYFKYTPLFTNSNHPEFKDVMYIVLAIFSIVIICIFLAKHWNQPLIL